MVTIIFIGIIVLIVIPVFKMNFSGVKLPIDKNNSINDLSYQKYANFYGEMAKADPEFVEKVNKIYTLIVKEKNENLDYIAEASGCTFSECLMKIKYLKNKRVLGDYYIDTLSHTIKLCDAKDKKLLAKYSKYIYNRHMDIDEIARSLPGATTVNVELKKKELINELKYLIDKSLINGVTINEIDGKLIYYTLEKKYKKEHNIVPMDCPHCGSLNEVNRGSKARCEYCGAIIEAPLQ